MRCLSALWADKKRLQGLKIKRPVNAAQNGRGQEKATEAPLTFIVTPKA